MGTDSPYGYCPRCGSKGATRERRFNGDDTCTAGHTYPSREAKREQPAVVRVVPMGEPEIAGPLVIAVCGHDHAHEFAHLLGGARGAHDQGVVVIPFGASALAYCDRGARLFRGLVMIPPRPGSSVNRAAFDGWIATSIEPYLAPLARKVIL